MAGSDEITFDLQPVDAICPVGATRPAFKAVVGRRFDHRGDLTCASDGGRSGWLKMRSYPHVPLAVTATAYQRASQAPPVRNLARCAARQSIATVARRSRTAVIAGALLVAV
jgi:hypothetical protein